MSNRSSKSVAASSSSAPAQLRVKPVEALRKKKEEEKMKNIVVYSLIAIGVLVNSVILYKQNISIHFELSETASEGTFLGDFKGLLAGGNQAKGCNDIASQLNSSRKRITSLELRLAMNELNAEHIGLISRGLVILDYAREIKISLSHNDIGDEGLIVLGQVLAQLPNLRTLSLAVDAMTFKNAALTAAIQILGQNRSLKHLTLSLIHNKIADDGAAALVAGFSQLKDQLESLSLILVSNGFSFKTGKIFGEFLPTLSKASSIYLSFNANNLAAEGATSLGLGLSKLHKRLSSLQIDLFFNNITDIGAHSLAYHVGSLTQLTTLKLNLEFNAILNEGGDSVGQALAKLTQLKTLHLNVATKNFGPLGFDHVAKGLQVLTNLEELSLVCGTNRIGVSGIESLKLVFANLTNLKKLRLDYYENSLGDRNGESVVQMLEGLKNVEELELSFSFNNLFAHGIAQILKGVQRMPALKKLSLDASKNEINNEDISTIFKELDLTANKIPAIKFIFQDTAITGDVAQTYQDNYLNHPVINLSINSSVAKEYLAERKAEQTAASSTSL